MPFIAKNKRLYLLAGVIICVATLCIYGYIEFNRKPADLIKSDAAENLAASDLYKIYTNHEDSANKKYLGKVLEITGAVINIENQQDTSVTILLGDSLQSGGVSCLLDKKQITATKNISKGDVLKLKGICTGFLMDVELNRCVIVKK